MKLWSKLVRQETARFTVKMEPYVAILLMLSK